MEEDRLKLLAATKKFLGLPIITVLINLCENDLVAKYVYVIQVGNRNICSFSLFKNRAWMNTIQEFLMSFKDILCERGTGTFETATRNILDLSLIHI